MTLPAAALSRRLWVRRALGFGGAVLSVYVFLALDTAARGREACREGDRAARAARDPAAKRRALDERFRRDQARLSRRGEAEALGEEVQRLERDLLRARHAAALARVDAGRAYQWYVDAYRLFSPPATRWTRRARLNAPAMKSLWRDEVRARGLPVRETFWDDAPGLDPARAVVYSAAARAEAERARGLLAAAGLTAGVVEDPRPRGAGDGYAVLVSTGLFWTAHRALAARLRLGGPAIVVESPR